MARTTYYWDMDGVIANFHKEPYKFANAINREWIANLEPFEENVATLRAMLKAKKSVYILTMAASENARLGKIDWLKKFVPELDTNNRFICIVGSGRKVDRMVTKNGVLIDDSKKNTVPWTKGGHKAILIERGAKVEI